MDTRFRVCQVFGKIYAKISKVRNMPNMSGNFLYAMQFSNYQICQNCGFLLIIYQLATLTMSESHFSLVSLTPVVRFDTADPQTDPIGLLDQFHPGILADHSLSGRYYSMCLLPNYHR